MTDMSMSHSSESNTPEKQTDFSVRLKKRYAAERRFRAYGLTAIAIAVSILGILLGTISFQGTPAFFQTYVQVDVYFDEAVIDPSGARNEQAMRTANYQVLAKRGLYELFPEVTERREKRTLGRLLSSGAYRPLAQMVLDDPEIIGTTQTVWLVTSDDIDTFYKGQIDRDTVEADRRVKDNEIAWVDALEADGRVDLQFNTAFFSTGDSREPELAGIWGAVVGSFLTLFVTLSVRLAAGVLGGGLFGRVCAQKPLDRPD